MLSGSQPALRLSASLITTQLSVSNSLDRREHGPRDLRLLARAGDPRLHQHHGGHLRRRRLLRRFALAAVASGISNDETVITCISEHDFLQVYPDVAASIVTGYAT
jgi:hypothetical protein